MKKFNSKSCEEIMTTVSVTVVTVKPRVKLLSTGSNLKNKQTVGDLCPPHLE